MTSKQPATGRKISEAFLEFSEPLWVTDGRTPTRAELERALKISWLVWNSAVSDAIGGNDAALRRLRESLGDVPAMLKVCELLLRRKKHLYAGDLRLITGYQIVDENGKWRLEVQAASDG